MAAYAVITGASSGIGLEFARLFAIDGINLVLAARDDKKLKRLSKDLRSSYGIEVHALNLDLSEVSGAKSLYEYTKSNKLPVEYLINNAGFGDYGAFVSTDWHKEQSMIGLNITTLTYLAKMYAKHFTLQNTGHIVNVSSTAAFQPGPFMSVYFATKSYVLHFSEAIAEELKESGVYVTALCPGPTKSNFQKAASMGKSKLFKNKNLPTSEMVARFGYRAMMQGKVVAVYGFRNILNTFAIRLLPRAWVRAIVKRAQI